MKPSNIGESNDWDWWRWAVAVPALAALFPLVAIFPALLRLIWFGDDWKLLSDYADVGLARWLIQPFAENFAPLFKLIWITLTIAFRGSYLGVLLVLWACHVVNLLLFGTLLLRSGVAPVATAGAVLAFGLSWTNLETLAWAPQISQVLSVTFFLAAWVLWDRVASRSDNRLAGIPLVATCSLASGLLFSRGVIGGAVLALYGTGERMLNRSRQSVAGLIVTVLITTVITFGATLHFSGGEFARFAGAGPRTVVAMGQYAVSYLALNPLLLLLRLPWQELGVATLTAIPTNGLSGGITGSTALLAAVVVGVAAVKLATVAVALQRTEGRTRLFLLTFLLLDLANALLLGIGRYQFGLGTAVSSRYQYLAWIGFAPSLGIVLDSIIRAIADRLGGTKRAARVVTVVVLASLVGFVAIPWPTEADRWAEWRGTAIRDELRTAPGNDRLSYSLVTVDRARELADRFELH